MQSGKRTKAASRKVRHDVMKEEQRIPPWWLRPIAAVTAAVAGNFIIAHIPWPAWMLEGYMQSAAPELGRDFRFLLMTLVLAPLLEEGIFRWGIFARLRSRISFWPAAVFSSLAFGLYHGNWIQGIYACFLGTVLAWCYDSSPRYKYLTAVTMHCLANLSALAVFGY